MEDENIDLKAEQFATEANRIFEEWIEGTQEQHSSPTLSGDELHEFYLKKQSLEAELFASIQQLSRLQQLEKPVNEWCNIEKKDISEEQSEELLENVTTINKENQNNIEERTLKPAVQAHEDLTKNLNNLKESLATLKDKRAKVFGSEKETLGVQAMQQFPTSLQLKKEKISLNHDVAKVEEEMLEDRISRLKSFHLVANEDLKAARAELAESEAHLSRLQKKAATLEQLSGIKCFVVDDFTLGITFSNESLLNTNCDHNLVVTLVFSEDDDGSLILSQVDVNQDFYLPPAVVKSATADNDLPKLVRILKDLWLSESTMVSEISSLRQSHAIDWKPEERILHLMVGKCIVCRLTVPPKYPLQGSVVLEQIVGNDVNTESISLPDSASLTQWVIHLKDVLTSN